MNNITPLPNSPDPDIALWLIDLDMAYSPADNAGLSPQEQARAARFKFERDARRYLCSHVALRHILGQCLQAAPQTLNFELGPHGKPTLAGIHSALHFNMSHSAGWALIGTCTSAAIGVDLELSAPMDDHLALAHHNFTPAEFQACVDTPQPQQLEAFLQGWTRKEACLKAVGSGLSIEPHVFEAGIDTKVRTTQITHDQHSWLVQVMSLDLSSHTQFKALASIAKMVSNN